MTIEEFLDWYVKRRIASVGILWDKKGGAWQGAYIYDNELRKQTINRLLEQDKLKAIQVDGIDETFYCLEDFFSSIESNREEDYARFIAPLDNMLWDRKMVEVLFNFSYRWEVYTPIIKRKYGYYVLPVLYNDKFVARFEAVPVKESKCFMINKWWWENDVLPNKKMIDTIMKEMERFSVFLDVDLCNENREKLEV